MIPVINDIDKLLQSAASRYGETLDRDLRLSASALTFEIALDATVSPAQIVFIASMLGVEGVATFSTDNGTPLEVVGNVATLTPGAMIDKACVVTATMTVQGEQFVAKQAVLKVLAFDPSTPPAPAGLTAVGKLASVRLNWTPTNNTNIAKVEIWRALTNSLAAAVPVGATAGLASTYTDTIGAAGSFFYWIRYISKANVIGLFNAVSGTAGASGTDADHLLELLQGQITESQLFAALQARINLVDAAGTGLVDKVAALIETYGNTEASAESAAEAAQSAADAVAAKAAALLAASNSAASASAASTSKVAAETANTAAGTSASAALTSANNASSSATTAGTAASAANTSKVAAETANTAAGASASAALTSANNASAYATNAGTAASASNTSKIAAETASSSAQGAAAAAATSRDTAAASATAAGTSASSASTSSNTASTKAGEASTSASNAATSASGAAGSATSASTSATDAAAARDAAGGSSAAAAGSASSASASATNAGTSASAANTAKVASESARDAAQGSASAASTSAATATTKAGEAGTSASAASGSASTASTKASEALSYRNAAAQSVTDAQGYANAAATDYNGVTARLNGAGGSGVTVEQALTAHASSITGYSGQVTTKIDINGYVTGYGLMSTANTSAPTSEFVILASAFKVVAAGASPTVMFSVSSGEVGFSGNLHGPSGSFGAMTIGVGGSISSGQTAYDTGTGFWLQGGSTPKMSMKTANGTKFLCDPANNVLAMVGAIVTGATINSPIFDTFSVSVGGDMTGSGANGPRTYGSRTATITGGLAPFSYAWSAVNQEADVPTTSVVTLNGVTTATVTAHGSVSNNILSCNVVVSVTDANGRTCTNSFYVSEQHGTPP